MSDTPCSSGANREFDFWVGEWDLSWPAEQTGGDRGERMAGHNSISRMFGDCVIEENFSTADGGFRGHSVSVFEERAGLWRQTWVDSAGAYLTLAGGMTDDGMVLATGPVETDDGTTISRMVFSGITSDSIEWSWQRSTDGGATWMDLWNISYRRSI